METAAPQREPGLVLVVSASIGAGHDGAAAKIGRRLRLAGCAV